MGVLDRLGKRAPSGESLSGNIFNWRACPRYNKLLLLPRVVITFKPLVPNPPGCADGGTKAGYAFESYASESYAFEAEVLIAWHTSEVKKAYDRTESSFPGII